MKFSANLGFLWTDLPLPNAIRAAASAGFDAVELHWPYDTDPEEISMALSETGLQMMGLNTRRGDIAAGENGLSALPGREAEARDAIDEALSYAQAIGARAVHVMAGASDHAGAFDVFKSNLAYAVERCSDVSILIEPLNGFDAPGYVLNSLAQAREVIESVNSPQLRLMFDCYHVGRTEGNVIKALDEYSDLIGHIQFASVPDRAAPNLGTLNYSDVFAKISAMGWTAPLGAEYKPNGPTEATLEWMKEYR